MCRARAGPPRLVRRGSVALFPARPDGSLAEAASVDQHTGSGPDASRQEGPHAHCIVLSARLLLRVQRGPGRRRKTIGYRVDYATNQLVRQNGPLPMPAGSGRDTSRLTGATRRDLRAGFHDGCAGL